MNRKADKEVCILVEKTLVTGDKSTDVYILRKRKMQSNRLSESIQEFLLKVEPYVFQFAVALAVTIISGFILVPIAETERGGPAFGGEWLALILIFWVSLKAADMIWEGHIDAEE